MTNPMVLYESPKSGAPLVSEANGWRSRDIITWDNTSGTLDLQLIAGMVYSFEALGGAVATANAGNHGNGTFGTITVNQETAQAGTYALQFTTATEFDVTAPNGQQLTPGTTGAAFSDELSFTITNGGTAYQAGDGYGIVVSAGTGYATQYTGTAPATGVLYSSVYVPAGGTLAVTGIAREAEVNLNELVWGSGVTTNQQAAALAQLHALGIIAR
jgi:hypothetical protein